MICAKFDGHLLIISKVIVN